MLKRYRSAAVAVVALLVSSGLLYAAGNYSMYPIVEGASFCGSTVSGAGGFNAAGTGGGGGATGQGQASSGSLCAQTIPAGPPAITGNEIIPADTLIGSGANPQTVVIPIALLNALPITVFNGVFNNQNFVTATNVTGGFIINAGATISAVKVGLPPTPLDGQQFAISADQIITTLLITSPTAGVTISNAATAMTPSATGAYGYRFMWNAASLNWYRLQ